MESNECSRNGAIADAIDNRLTIWGLRQKILQQFLATWLQMRNKWYNIEANRAPGDMVIVTRENTPPSAWPLGRIITTTTGEDGLVRVATINVPSKMLRIQYKQLYKTFNINEFKKKTKSCKGFWHIAKLSFSFKLNQYIYISLC